MFRPVDFGTGGGKTRPAPCTDQGRGTEMRKESPCPSPSHTRVQTPADFTEEYARGSGRRLGFMKSQCLLKELPKKGKQAPGAPAAPRRSVEEKLTCDCLSCEPGESSLPLWSPLTVFFPPKEQLTHPGYSDTGTREMFLKSEQSEPGTVREATGSVGCQS